MTELKVFLSLLSVLHSAAKELGIDGLTKSDEQVLFVLWEFSDNDDKEFQLTYSAFEKKASKLNISVSRAQFFRSLKILESHGLISKIGSERSRTYKILLASS